MDRAPTARLAARPRWLVVAAVAGLILVASVVRLPGGGLGQLGLLGPLGSFGPLGPFGAVETDKWLHALAYAGLAGVLAYALADVERSTLVVVALVLVGSLTYGFAIELIQAPLPYRQFELLDLAADAVGATLAVAVWRGIAHLRRARATTTG